MFRFGLNGKRLLLILTDGLGMNLAVYAALLARFEGQVPEVFLRAYLEAAIPYTLASLVVYFLSGLYHRAWKYASLPEGLLLVRSTLAGSLILALLVLFPAGAGFPRSVLILGWIFTLMAVSASRLTGRALANILAREGRAAPSRRRTILVGAGDAGAMVARELAKHPEIPFQPVGFLDDDPAKKGMRVFGLPVLGTRQDLEAVILSQSAAEVIITMPSAPAGVIREILATCSHLQIKPKILPGVYELLNGAVTVNLIREVSLEDLLGRRPVEINLAEVSDHLRGERILVTGAGGSIGSELCRQVADFHPSCLLLLGHQENEIFEIQLELQAVHPDLECHAVIADIRDRSKIESVFRKLAPAVIFHAAAHKHVHLMEASPDEAVKTNVLGTRNVIAAATGAGARKVVLVSTDKAINPIGVMGLSKRVAELLIQQPRGAGVPGGEEEEEGDEATTFVAVRFGNVLGSRGSVVEVFRKQIARGGPITVTHPGMTRYFMTISEAVRLLIQASAFAEDGAIYALEMGSPINIMDLARNLIRLSGLNPERDIPIVFTGPRPGERLEEPSPTPVGSEPTRHPKIFKIRAPRVGPDRLAQAMDILEAGAAMEDGETLVRRMEELALEAEAGVEAKAKAEAAKPIGGRTLERERV
ncbi:MAG: polysaccharide biosynthesis protein [Firmicutes bacterium]|nr:polysaccharide biosynthesis protein [Bacillota bacterium]